MTILAKNTDGSFNEQYCMWCWDGEALPRTAPWRRWWSTACPTCPWAGRIRRRAALYAEPSAHTGAMERELTQAPDCGNPRSGAWIFSGQLRKTAFAHIDPMGELPERIRSMAADAGGEFFLQDYRAGFSSRKNITVSRSFRDRARRTSIGSQSVPARPAFSVFPRFSYLTSSFFDNLRFYHTKIPEYSQYLYEI